MVGEAFTVWSADIHMTEAACALVASYLLTLGSLNDGSETQCSSILNQAWASSQARQSESVNAPAGLAMSLEERGLVVNWSTLRMAVGQGGDGDSHMKADVDNLAAFVRDPGACVTCLLLPFSGSMEPGYHACRGNNRLSS